MEVFHTKVVHVYDMTDVEVYMYMYMYSGYGLRVQVDVMAGELRRRLKLGELAEVKHDD
jgi:hypothetical protein